ncbi:MAG: aminoglycoside phosphotransferase family protein [Chloroflexota bacterium]|nr:aminoglycoside phosphotransferase family protein [Chloroflexota bacterium]
MTEWVTFLYALLPHPDQPLVLAQNASERITLPNKACDFMVWASNTLVLKPLLEELTQAPINILRYVAHHRDEDARRVYCIHLLELRNGALPQNAIWQPLEKVLDGMPSVLQDGLVRWQIEQRSGNIPERRAPWAIPGWHAKVEHWIANQVAHLGRGAAISIQPIKSWSISCVLKVTTETGDLYFKMARDLPLFVNEGAVLARLVELYPDRLPMPVALASKQGWMLLNDFGDSPDDDASLDQQAHLMQDFARLQIDSSRKIEALLAAGCKDRRLDVLLSQIEPLLDDELALRLLDPEERRSLKQVAPRLKSLIAELFSLSVPVTLLHGDLHAGNVILHENSFLYFDWTDAAVSHPFFDMIHILMEKDEGKRTALQEAYLLPWEENYPKADVRRAWGLASVLYGLYHAVSYQYIVHGIEELVQPELNFTHYYLRKLLEGIK